MTTLDDVAKKGAAKQEAVSSWCGWPKTEPFEGTHSVVQSLCGVGLVGRGPLEGELGSG